MNKIKLHNRDGANLWLEQINKIENTNISVWKLKADDKHQYCLEYIRVIGDYPHDIYAVDPSGGPFISLADEFEEKYKIIKIINPTTFEIIEKKWEQ